MVMKVGEGSVEGIQGRERVLDTDKIKLQQIYLCACAHTHTLKHTCAGRHAHTHRICEGGNPPFPRSMNLSFSNLKQTNIKSMIKIACIPSISLSFS